MTSFRPNQAPPGTASPDLSVGRECPACLSAGTHKLAILIDERRELAAKVAGKDVEISIALGDRDAARRALNEMKAQIEARRGVREAGCFFDQAGELDAKTVQKSGKECAL